MPETEDELKETILHLDSIFWKAYNVCDVDVMHSFLADDLEFYHDKQGLTQTADTLKNGVRTGLCGNPDWWLRREAIEGSVEVFPIANYGAIISGEHLFFINETGKEEYLGEHAKFTHLWKLENNEWKMTRVLSYDHGPPPEQFCKKK